MQGFTIIEIVLTLTLIGILLGLGQGLNQSYIQDLQLQTQTNQLRQSYQQRLHRSMQTSYFNNQRFSYTNVYIEQSENTTITSTYELPVPTNSAQNIQKEELTDILFTNKKIDINILSPVQETIHIRKQPYELSCTINDGEETQALFQVSLGKASECFIIEAHTCKIHNANCTTMD